MVNIDLILIIFLFLIWLIYFPWLIYDLNRELTRFWIVRYRARWWYNPPKGKNYKRDEKKEWKFIKNVLLLKKQNDPLIVSKSMRKGSKLISCIILSVLLIALFSAAFYIKQFIDETISLSINEKLEPFFVPFAIIVSFLGAVMVAIGKFFTIRVKGRASSRQDWIKDVRAILAELTSSMPISDSDHDMRQCQRSKNEHKFRELELHLNPSEKMHRSLLYAIRLAYGADWLNDDEDDEDDEVEKNLRLRNSDDWRDGKLRRAGIIRLSQVVLKREWEQTKKLR